MHDIEPDLQKLIEALQKTDPAELRFDESFLHLTRFFERLLYASQTAAPEQQQEWTATIMEIAQQLQGTLKKFVEATGLSEEELLQYADQSENFNKEKWAQYQEARKQIAEMSKKIALSLKVVAQPQLKQEPEESAKPAEKKKTPHPKRSDWMKS